MTFQKMVVVDGRDHMVGRMASIVAKQLLSGQQVVVVRAEQVVVSGSAVRHQMKWARFMRKRTNTNPKWGPFHHRAPSRIVFRTIRGMIPHKTQRGALALQRLKEALSILPRSKAYPDLEEQLDLLWHAIDADADLKTKLAGFYNAIKPVKDANPKG